MEDLHSMTKSELIEYIKMLDDELIEEKEKRKEESNEYLVLQQEYENIIDKLNKELLKLRGKVISQDITLASYKDKIGKPIIVEGKEHDLYTGEQKDLIIDILEANINNYPKFTRSYNLIESILSSNTKNGEKDNLKKSLASIFKGYNGINKDTISKLNNLGFSVVYDGSNHYTLFLGNDDRFSVFISHSASDYRAGLNILSDINKVLL